MDRYAKSSKLVVLFSYSPSPPVFIAETVYSLDSLTADLMASSALLTFLVSPVSLGEFSATRARENVLKLKTS